MTEQSDIDEPPDVPTAFEIDSDVSANWLVRKIVEARAYAQQVKAWADLEVRRAERDERFFMQRFGAQLESWARGQIALRRGKSIKLPAGTIGFRTESAKLSIVNDERLITWCERCLPGALRIETRIVKTTVNEHFDQTGECPEGVEIVGGGQRFYVR